MPESSGFRALRGELSHLCVKAEDLCREFNLPSISRITIIARDPANDEMSVLVTNEPDVTEAARLIHHLAGTEADHG